LSIYIICAKIDKEPLLLDTGRMKSKVPSTINVPLRPELRQLVNEKLERSGLYSSTAEYVRDLIRKDVQREAVAQVDALLLEGLSTPGAPMSKKDWKELRQIANRRPHRNAQKNPRSSRRRSA